MELDILMHGERKKIEIHDGATGRELISKLGLMPDEVILIAGGKPVPYTEVLDDVGELKVVRVASGG
jgi:sulfur carrier protein ThiS